MSKQRFLEQQNIIIESAAQIISIKGIANTSLKDIAEKAGMSKGALYHYYSTKNALLYDLLDANLSETSDMAESLMTGASENKEDLENDIVETVFARFLKKDINRINHYLVEEALMGNQEILNTYQGKYKEWNDSIYRLLKLNFVSEENEALKTISGVILALIDGVCIHEMLGMENINPEKLEKMIRLFLRSDIIQISEKIEEI